MSSIRNVLPVLVLGACAPQNATLTSGSYISFFSDGSSLSLIKGSVDPASPEWDASYNIDCREFETQADEDNRKLDDPLRICGEMNWPPAHEEWATQAGYRVVAEELDPWRGEAVMTSEGDLQIAFHHRLPSSGEQGLFEPKSADFRIIMSVDPNFQPTTCVPLEGGGVEREDLDGDWIENWSSELQYIGDQNEAYRQAFDHLEPFLQDGRLFLLNGTGYQRNPRNVDDFWFLPPQWVAGSALGKISEELMFHRAPRYAVPTVYNDVEDPAGDEGFTAPVNENDLWFCDLAEGADPTESTCIADMQDEIRLTADEIHDELDRMFSPDEGVAFEYRPITHANTWRPIDGVPAGLDGWGELHYNYVVFSGDSDLTVGGSARGAFGIVLDALDSQTTLFAKGTFEIDKIKQDRWVTDDLQAVKAEEAGVDLCFQQ